MAGHFFMYGDSSRKSKMACSSGIELLHWPYCLSLYGLDFTSSAEAPQGQPAPLIWVPFSWFCTVIMEYVIVGSTLGAPMLGNPELDVHRTSGEASYPQCPPSPPATLNPKSFSQDLRHCADICGLQAALTRVRQNMCQATFCAFKL